MGLWAWLVGVLNPRGRTSPGDFWYASSMWFVGVVGTAGVAACLGLIRMTNEIGARKGLVPQHPAFVDASANVSLLAFVGWVMLGIPVVSCLFVRRIRDAAVPGRVYVLPACIMVGLSLAEASSTPLQLRLALIAGLVAFVLYLTLAPGRRENRTGDGRTSA